MLLPFLADAPATLGPPHLLSARMRPLARFSLFPRSILQGMLGPLQ